MIIRFLLFCLFLGLQLIAQAQNSTSVFVSGAMRNVMWKGQLKGTIQLDSLEKKSFINGLGPLEFLQGELLIFNGKAYQSQVKSASKMSVTQSFHAKAPFFVYAQVPAWTQHALPDSIVRLDQLEDYLNKLLAKVNQPVPFQLMGIIEIGNVHVVHLAPGSVVKSPDDAHKGQVNYPIFEKEGSCLGFYSREHKGIFTHHDTNIHLHFLSSDEQFMGHLEYATFQSNTFKLFLPSDLKLN